LTVAEIMNAKDFLNVVKFVHDREGSNVAIAMTGVWRRLRLLTRTRTTSLKFTH
jgi:hypothetical protein